MNWHQSTKELYAILENIAEWRSGCSNGGPGECHECTMALIHAIEKKAERGVLEAQD